MGEIDIRGGRGAGASLELTGPFTGYANGPTMQIGLWICNDGDRIDDARTAVLHGGAMVLAQHLGPIIRYFPVGAPAAVRDTVTLRDLIDNVDWAQIAYSLLDSDPTDDDMQAAESARYGGLSVSAVDAERRVVRRAFQLAHERTKRVALYGAEG